MVVEKKERTKREVPLEQSLYEDARRRKEENERKKEDLDKVRDQPKDKIFVNKN